MYNGKPVIGLMPLHDMQENKIWLRPGYMKSLEEQGAIPMMLPLTDDEKELAFFLDICDGFVFTGGPDILPAYFGEETMPECGAINPERDVMECWMLKEAVKRDKAILGICRGHQVMNVVFGGTLYQDIPTQCPSEVFHRRPGPDDWSEHWIAIEPGSPLRELLGVSECLVNSNHHQAVKDISPAFLPMAASPDGLNEAIYMPGKRFVWGVQWHPENSYQTSVESRKIIGAFLKAAKGE